MIAKREEAKRKREEEELEEARNAHPLDEAMAEIDMEQKRRAHPSLTWKSSLSRDADNRNNNNNSHDDDDDNNKNTSLYAKRQKRLEGRVRVPTLFQTCVNFVVQNFEYVESLGDVDSSIRRAIAQELVAQNKLDRAAYTAIVEPGMEALELVDCAELTQDHLAESLKSLLPMGLRYLLLHHAGRCFGPRTVKAIRSVDDCKLFALSIAGAYMLSDQDVADLIHHLSDCLTSLEFRACPLLGDKFCQSIPAGYGESGLLVELSLEDMVLSKEAVKSLGSTALRNLKSLSLRQVESVDDEVVLHLLDHVQHLEGIDLSFNHNITDAALSAIRSCNTNGTLRSLTLSGLKNLTQVGIETLFTDNLKGLPSPPRLRRLNLSECDFAAVTDNIVDLACKASSMKRLDGSISDTLSTTGGLVYVALSGSSCTDYAMESLAATSARSLQELNVCFCPKITNKGLGYLVSKTSHQFRLIHIWGNAQITEEFLDGHDRCDDTSFDVEGAWMKKTN